MKTIFLITVLQMLMALVVFFSFMTIIFVDGAA